MRKIAIIGAGLTGLSAGIVLEKHGISTTIYEKAPWAGGVCTAWIRKGYTFDGCIHWMVGTKPNEPMRKIYESVQALKSDTQIFHIDKLIIEIDGETFEIPLVLEQFKAFLLNVSPQDTSLIHHFCTELNRVIHSEMIPGNPATPKEYFHAVTKGRNFLSIVLRYLDITVESYFNVSKNEKFIKIIHHLMDPSMSMFALLMMLGSRMGQNGGFPEGGARDMIDRMQSYYLSLGGTLKFNTEITELCITNHQVTHVKNEKNEYPATHVIAACDMHYTLNHMLKGNYPHPVLDRMLKKSPLFDTIMLISLGLNQKFNIPYGATYEIPNGLNVGGEILTHQYFIRSFDFDKSLAPSGKSSVMITLSAPFDYWLQLKKTDEKTYRREKMVVANHMISILEQRYPGIQDAIEVIDVATPATYSRLNNLYQGSYEGFMPLPGALKEKIKTRIDGIKNLYLAGQWVTPGGGIPPAIMSGIHTAKQIIKKR